MGSSQIVTLICIPLKSSVIIIINLLLIVCYYCQLLAHCCICDNLFVILCLNGGLSNIYMIRVTVSAFTTILIIIIINFPSGVLLLISLT